MSKIKMVTIPEAEYDHLQEDSEFLADLEAAGVDNTQAYEEACYLRRHRLNGEDV